jgi:hypothetical protein
VRRRTLIERCLRLRLMAVGACLAACGAAPSTKAPSSPPPNAAAAPASAAAERPFAVESSAKADNPYAPHCITPLQRYAWQNPKQPACGGAKAVTEQDGSDTTQVKLTFFDSVAAFPLLPEDETGVVPPKPEADGAPALAASAPARRDPDFVVASLRPRLRSCFTSLLERSERAEGSIRFALGLGCAGEVQTISANTEGVDEPTIECLFKVVAPAMFEPPATGHATIQVPVVFKNSAR